MLQKIDLQHLPLIIQGSGRIDETRPIDLLEYVLPYDRTRNNVYPIQIVPQKNNYSMKIGGTTFDVTTHFNDQGRQSVLEQFKELILSERLI